MKTYTIYKYTSPSGRCYVGQTNNEKKRKSYHLCSVRAGSMLPFHCALRKYGINNFTYEVLETDIPESEVDDMEIAFIGNEEGFSKGYNCTIGGEGVKGVSKETRKKMSEWQIGRVLTEEHKEKIRKNSTHNKPVKCIETGVIYFNSMEAQRQTGVSSSNIRQVCKNKRKTAGGFSWCWEV